MLILCVNPKCRNIMGLECDKCHVVVLASRDGSRIEHSRIAVDYIAQMEHAKCGGSFVTEDSIYKCRRGVFACAMECQMRVRYDENCPKCLHEWCDKNPHIVYSACQTYCQGIGSAYSIELRDGWRSEGSHEVLETTASAALLRLRKVQPCGCGLCAPRPKDGATMESAAIAVTIRHGGQQ